MPRFRLDVPFVVGIMLVTSRLRAAEATAAAAADGHALYVRHCESCHG